MKIWKRKRDYLLLAGPALLEYAHNRGVWLTDPNFTGARDIAEAEDLMAESVGDEEIRRRIRAVDHEQRDNRVAYAAMWSAVASVASAVVALVAVICK